MNEEDFIILKKAINSTNPLLYSDNITEPGASSATAVTVEDFKFKVLSVKSSKPDSLESGKKFEDSFFIKIKNNVVIKEYLLQQQGLENTVSTGDLHILEDNFEFGGYTGGGVEIGFYEDRDNRTTYYFKNGRVYEVQGAILSNTSTSSAATDSSAPSGPSCFTPSTGTSNWYDAGISTCLLYTSDAADD